MSNVLSIIDWFAIVFDLVSISFAIYFFVHHDYRSDLIVLLLALSSIALIITSLIINH